jgi:hypothetical protein
MFILTNIYSQYVFQSDALPKKNIVASLYHHYGCWSERFGYSIYNDTLRQLRCFKTANDDLGFTQNNFLGKMHPSKLTSTCG